MTQPNRMTVDGYRAHLTILGRIADMGAGDGVLPSPVGPVWIAVPGVATSPGYYSVQGSWLVDAPVPYSYAWAE